MPAIQLSIEDFLSEVGSESGSDNRNFVEKIHGTLMSDGYKSKIEPKASGPFASYSHPKTKRSLLNVFFRKKGLMVRIYSDNIGNHAELLEGLPGEMENEIKKAPACKRLIDPDSCNPKCIMGYDFTINGARYQKCRYACFEFTVGPGSIPHIIDFIEAERDARAG